MPALPTSRRVPRLLMSAYAASPYRGSESAMGWNQALQAARFNDVWLICEETEFGPDIRRYLDEHGPIPGLEFVFVPMGRTWRKLGNLPPFWYPALKQWQKKVLAVAQRLHAEVQFDLTHHLTFSGYREPGYLWRLGAPHIWGPVGGVQSHPRKFLMASGLRGGLVEAGRNVLNAIQLRTSRRVREAGRESACVVAANSENQRVLEQILHRPVRKLVEVGVPPAFEADLGAMPVKSRAPGDPLRILWAGWIIPRKALHLLIEAAAIASREIPLEIKILGKGSHETANRRLARQRGIADRVEFLGWRPHHEVVQRYDEAHCFAFTSVRDTSGTVILEALARGAPTICLDHQGVGELVTPQCGIKIPVTNPHQAAREIAQAFIALYRDNGLLGTLSQGARLRAREFVWRFQGDRMADIYRQVLAASGCDHLALRPDLCASVALSESSEDARLHKGFGETCAQQKRSEEHLAW